MFSMVVKCAYLQERDHESAVFAHVSELVQPLRGLYIPRKRSEGDYS